MNKIFKPNPIWPAVFIAASIAASLVRFTPFLAGKLNFTLFDLYAPIAGGLFGAGFGALAVLAASLGNLVLQHSYSLAGALHLLPVLFGVWYFAAKRRLVAIIPVLAILGFWATPVGREVWYYPLFWLIPLVCLHFKDKSVWVNALGATFTAHAAGGVLWALFLVPPASVWQALIPVVIAERLIFTVTIVLSYKLVLAVKREILQSKPLISSIDE